jgi:HEPN domain-containing protein
MAKMVRFISSKEFLRAGRQRLQAAEILKDSGIHLEAIYLAGYTIECSLKAVIVENTPSGKRSALMETITRGVKAHDFGFLLELLLGYRVNVPLELRNQLRLARSI